MYNAYLYLKGSSRGAEITRELQPGGLVSLVLRNPSGEAITYDLEVGGSEATPQLSLRLHESGKLPRIIYSESLVRREDKYYRRADGERSTP